MSQRVSNVKGQSKRCCENGQHKKKLIALPGCTADDVAVAALPENWVPRKAGTILKNYLKEREQNHGTILENITKKAAVINNNVDSKIRRRAEYLLCYIKQNYQDMNCIIEILDVRKPDPSDEMRNEALNGVRKLHSQRIDEISIFKREALVLENERADEIRKLLQEQFQCLVSVGHHSPRHLLHEFDQQVYEINQQLLSNSRAYVELEAQLLAQLDVTTIEVKASINQICLGFCIGPRHSFYRWQREENMARHLSSSISSDVKVFKPSLSHIIDEAQEFDECVTFLVQAYRTAVLKILNGFTRKLSDLQSHMGSFSFLDLEPEDKAVMDLQGMIDRILMKLSVNLEKQSPTLPAVIDLARMDAQKMQKSLWSLGERLRDVYTILHDSAHLWDGHMLRSALAQKLTIACVEDLLTCNDIAELANEVNFNIALEQLRSASDVEKLQQQYELVITTLERTAEMYKQHSETESARLECFMNYPESMANILLSEFNCFLEKFPINSVFISDTGLRQTNDFSINSPQKDVKSLQMPLPRAILQTELQGLYLLNWRNGFLETFANSLSNLQEELTHHVRIWVDEKARTLNMRHSLKNMSLSIRKERVKAAFNLRLAELKHHDIRLESHLNAIYNLVESLPLDAAEFLSLDAPELYPFCNWLKQIQDNIDVLSVQDSIDPEVKKMKMCSYSLRLEKHRKLFENSLDEAIDICKRQMENRIQEARISNVRFASQLKLFCEGGRYSAQEATKTSALLMKAADSIESCLSRTAEILNHRQTYILTLADQKLQPIKKIVDEFTKSAKGGAKGGVVDKRKPAPTSKKK